jgi:hypothetical protein
VNPPPVSCVAVDPAVSKINDVPALKVKFVPVKATADTVVLKVTVLDPKLMVRTVEPVDVKADAVTLKFFVSNVPLVTVSGFVLMFNASTSSTVPPGESIVIDGCIVLPAEVIV